MNAIPDRVTVRGDRTLTIMDAVLHEDAAIALAPVMVRNRHRQSAEVRAFCAAIPEYVDGGAQIVAVCRYRLADQDGPASATVLADWGDDDSGDDPLPRWGTHVMTYEPDWRRFLLWHGRYFADLREAWTDLGHRLP